MQRPTSRSFGVPMIVGLFSPFLLAPFITPAIADDEFAPAASVARSLDELNGRIKQGTRVALIDTAGREITGRIAGFPNSTLVLEHRNGQLEIPEAKILRIRRDGDAVWNGTLYGAGIGAASGLLWGAAWCKDSIGIHCLSGRVQAQFSAFWAVTGAGVGALVDWARPSRELLFQAEAPHRRSVFRSIRVAPVVSRHTKGMALSVGW